MTSGMYSRVARTSVKPWRLSRSMMCSMHGLLTIEIMGFGWLLVNGRSRVPFPPAMITAFKKPRPPSSFRPPSYPEGPTPTHPLYSSLASACLADPQAPRNDWVARGTFDPLFAHADSGGSAIKG